MFGLTNYLDRDTKISISSVESYRSGERMAAIKDNLMCAFRKSKIRRLQGDLTNPRNAIFAFRQLLREATGLRLKAHRKSGPRQYQNFPNGKKCFTCRRKEYWYQIAEE